MTATESQVSCGAAKLVRDTRNVHYTYKGETTVLPQVTLALVKLLKLLDRHPDLLAEVRAS